MPTDEPARWTLTLYVNGASPQSVAALSTMQEICDEQAPGTIELTVVDVRDRPALAIQDQVLAVPTLVKNLPDPVRRLVGHLADPERVRVALDLGPLPSPDPATIPEDDQLS